MSSEVKVIKMKSGQIREPCRRLDIFQWTRFESDRSRCLLLGHRFVAIGKALAGLLGLRTSGAAGLLEGGAVVGRDEHALAEQLVTLGDLGGRGRELHAGLAGRVVHPGVGHAGGEDRHALGVDGLHHREEADRDGDGRDRNGRAVAGETLHALPHPLGKEHGLPLVGGLQHDDERPDAHEEHGDAGAAKVPAPPREERGAERHRPADDAEREEALPEGLGRLEGVRVLLLELAELVGRELLQPHGVSAHAREEQLHPHREDEGDPDHHHGPVHGQDGGAHVGREQLLDAVHAVHEVAPDEAEDGEHHPREPEAEAEHEAQHDPEQQQGDEPERARGHLDDTGPATLLGLEARRQHVEKRVPVVPGLRPDVRDRVLDPVTGEEGAQVAPRRERHGLTRLLEPLDLLAVHGRELFELVHHVRELGQHGLEALRVVPQGLGLGVQDLVGFPFQAEAMVAVHLQLGELFDRQVEVALGLREGGQRLERRRLGGRRRARGDGRGRRRDRRGDRGRHGRGARGAGGRRGRGRRGRSRGRGGGSHGNSCGGHDGLGVGESEVQPLEVVLQDGLQADLQVAGVDLAVLDEVLHHIGRGLESGRHQELPGGDGSGDERREALRAIPVLEPRGQAEEHGPATLLGGQREQTRQHPNESFLENMVLELETVQDRLHLGLGHAEAPLRDEPAPVGEGVVCPGLGNGHEHLVSGYTGRRS